VIVIDMDQGKIRQVSAAGHVQGAHLDPVAMKDTTKTKPAKRP